MNPAVVNALWAFGGCLVGLGLGVALGSRRWTGLVDKEPRP